MVFRGIVAAAASLALMATPAMAAGSASAAAAQAATTEVAPAGETADGLQLGGGNMVIVVLALIAVGLGIWAALDGDDDAPASP